MRAGFGKPADGHFDPGHMDVNAFALIVVVGDLKRVVHATSASFAERANAVVSLRVIGRERKIIRRKLDGLAIQRERLVKNLLLVDAVKRPRILAEKITVVAKFWYRRLAGFSSMALA